MDARGASAKPSVGGRLSAEVSLAAILFVLLSAPVARAQKPAPAPAPAAATAEPRLRESVAIETNLTAQRQVELARVHLSEKRWSEGIELVRQVAANDGGSLIAVGPGRYLSVELYAQMLLAALPPEGLALARKTIDDSARTALADAVRNRDEAALRTLVQKMYVAKSTEPALLTLGQWAWESGNLTAARGYWTQLLPLPDGAAEPVGTLLRYPDPQIDPAEIAARLVTGSLVEGNRNVARAQLTAFRRRFGQARGRLGGREGMLADLLEESALRARSWSIPPRDTVVTTFGVNVARDGVLPREIEVGAARWSADLPPDPYAPVRSQVSEREALSIFPVVSGKLLFINTAEQILAWDVRTGRPAWQRERGDNAVLYSATVDASAPPPLLVGAPRYTMSVADGRLYARMGDPATIHPRASLHESESSLVCLDVAREEGKLLWKVDAGSLDPQSEFEGSPIVVHGRAYVAVRKGRPRMQTDIACLEAESGRRLWSRSVCAAVEDVGQSASLMSHQLLTAGDDAVFLATGLGAIAAIEAEDGAPRWVVTYESGERENPPNEQERRENSPCLFAQNIVIAAPADSKTLFALDSRTGATLWRRALPGGVEHLLGTKDGVLIVSGRALWGLSLATGQAAWPPVAFTDPASFGFGRGILAGDVVYWPTREDIYVVDQATGVLRRRIPLLARYAESGGNLVLAGDELVVAQSNRIVVFGPAAGPPLRKKQPLPATLTRRDPPQRLAESRVTASKTGLFPIFAPR